MKKLLLVLVCGMMVAGVAVAERGIVVQVSLDEVAASFEVEGTVIGQLDLFTVCGGWGGARRRIENTGGGERPVRGYYLSKLEWEEGEAQTKKEMKAMKSAAYDIACAVVAIENPWVGVAMYSAGRLRQCRNESRGDDR
jgi:hypothetical protein